LVCALGCTAHLGTVTRAANVQDADYEVATRLASWPDSRPSGLFSGVSVPSEAKKDGGQMPPGGPDTEANGTRRGPPHPRVSRRDAETCAEKRSSRPCSPSPPLPPPASLANRTSPCVHVSISLRRLGAGVVADNPCDADQDSGAKSPAVAGVPRSPSACVPSLRRNGDFGLSPCSPLPIAPPGRDTKWSDATAGWGRGGGWGVGGWGRRQSFARRVAHCVLLLNGGCRVKATGWMSPA
jgi:hypothetical protein